MTPILRPATPKDMAALLRIERDSFRDSPWNAEELTADDCTVAEMDGEVVGFLISRQTFPAAAGAPAEREILNLAVAGQYRRRGIATALINHELERRAVVFLEVRESNVAAQSLYRKLGFVEIGRRPKYYESPLETAIVMRMK